MSKKINTVVDDVYKTIDKGLDSLKEEHLNLFLKDMSEAVHKQLLNKDRNRGTYLRVSNLGHPSRKLWYDLHNTKGEELQPSTRIKFLYGDIIEALVLFLVRLSGHDVTDEQKEVNIDGIKGHMDCKIDGVVTDVKSAAAFSFLKFCNGSLLEDDPFGYVAQISGYAGHEGQDEAAFLAIDKESGELALMKLNDMDLIDPYEKVSEMKKVVALDTPPERCYSPVDDGKSGNKKLAKGCNYCSYKETCWSHTNDGQGLRVFSYSTGPRYLTEVVRVPDVVEM